MPIYAYRCESCGFEKDALRKMSDAPLTQCPACQGETFVKQVTAAGFQLKGSGWYVTDFRGGSRGASSADNAKKDAGEAKPAAADSSAGSSAGSGESTSAASSDAKASTSTADT